MPTRNLKILSGPLLFVLINILNINALPSEGQSVLAITVWMATWWTIEAVPIAITALLPLILFPLTGVLTLRETGATYGHPIIFLFIGGFMIATSIEKWQLHTRVALNIITKLGSHPKSIILGFMIATAALSMWISNTATTLMMLPISIAVIDQISGGEGENDALHSAFSKALLLGIAYSASIGGIATLIGTPTNVIFAGVFSDEYGLTISFAEWMLFACPLAIFMLFMCWYYLVHIRFKMHQTSDHTSSKISVTTLLEELGPTSYEEKVIVIVFSVVAFCWITRSSLINPFMPNLSDPIIAMIGAIILFLIPCKKETDEEGNSKTILDWATAVNIPWGVILLFGGGLSLAKAFELSGLAHWIGIQVALLGIFPTYLILLCVITLVIFFTEISSNIATISMILPVLGSLATTINLPPHILMIGATCAASCAFMLPVATAPNAIIFGSNRLHIKDMIYAGFAMNVISTLIISIYAYFLVPVIFL